MQNILESLKTGQELQLRTPLPLLNPAASTQVNLHDGDDILLLQNPLAQHAYVAHLEIHYHKVFQPGTRRQLKEPDGALTAHVQRSLATSVPQLSSMDMLLGSDYQYNSPAKLRRTGTSDRISNSSTTGNSANSMCLDSS